MAADDINTEPLYPTCGKRDRKQEYHLWRGLKAGSVELPLLLVFPPEPLDWALEVLGHLEGQTVAVPNPSVDWAPPWQNELTREPQPGGEEELSPDYWSEEVLIIRGQEYMVPQKWCGQPFDRGELEVKIGDWLPAVCGYCSFTKPRSGLFGSCQWAPLASLGCTVYAPTSLKCPWRWQSLIEIDERARSSRSAFLLIFAHEVAHAIGRMHYVVPAIMDWDGFLKNVLHVSPGEVVNPEDLPREFEYRNSILDSSVAMQTTETAYLERLFGTDVQQWYEGSCTGANLLRRTEGNRPRAETPAPSLWTTGWTLPRRSRYSPAANSRTSGSLIGRWAAKSNVSRVLVTGNRAALIRRLAAQRSLTSLGALTHEPRERLTPRQHLDAGNSPEPVGERVACVRRRGHHENFVHASVQALPDVPFGV